MQNNVKVGHAPLQALLMGERVAQGRCHPSLLFAFAVSGNRFICREFSERDASGAKALLNHPCIFLAPRFPWFGIESERDEWAIGTSQSKDLTAPLVE